MKLSAVLLSAVAALALPGSLPAGAAPAAAIAVPPSAQAIVIPAILRAQIDAAVAACGCFSSVTPWQVDPDDSPAADVFASPDVLLALVGQDVQLPWVAAGEVDRQALGKRLGRQAGVLDSIAAFADPSGGGYRLGAYSWSHPSQPDFCSGQTLYLMYFERTGVLFAFRFDSSHEC